MHGVFVGITGGVGVDRLQFTHGVGDGRHGRGVRVGVDVNHQLEVGEVGGEHTGQQLVCIAAKVPQKSGVETAKVGKTSVGTTMTMVVAVGMAVGIAVSIGIAVAKGNAVGAGCCC